MIPPVFVSRLVPTSITLRSNAFLPDCCVSDRNMAIVEHGKDSFNHGGDNCRLVRIQIASDGAHDEHGRFSNIPRVLGSKGKQVVESAENSKSLITGTPSNHPTLISVSGPNFPPPLASALT